MLAAVEIQYSDIDEKLDVRQNQTHHLVITLSFVGLCTQKKSQIK